MWDVFCFSSFSVAAPGRHTQQGTCHFGQKVSKVDREEHCKQASGKLIRRGSRPCPNLRAVNLHVSVIHDRTPRASIPKKAGAKQMKIAPSLSFVVGTATVASQPAKKRAKLAAVANGGAMLQRIKTVAVLSVAENSCQVYQKL